MKKLFFLLSMCSILTFISCKKDKDDESSEFMTATIDGGSFVAETVSSSLDTSFGESLLLSSGTNEDQSFKIGLIIPQDIPINEVQIIDDTDFGITFTDADDNIFYTVGTVELTVNDTIGYTMEGIFSFTATEEGNETNVHEVTNGAFKFIY